MSDMVPVADLIWDEKLYPRQTVSLYHVTEIRRAMDGGSILPPVVACRARRVLVDGVHRWHAAQRAGQREIEVEWRDYPEGEQGWEEIFTDSALLNHHGLALSAYDRLRVMDIGRERFGMDDARLAQIMGTSETYLRKIKPRYATIADAATDVPNLRRVEAGDAAADPARLRRVALKQSIRHLAGERINAEQEEAIAGAPGIPYAVIVNQLISGLRTGLLPEPDRHPVLWQRLRELEALLAELT